MFKKCFPPKHSLRETHFFERLPAQQEQQTATNVYVGTYVRTNVMYTWKTSHVCWVYIVMVYTHSHARAHTFAHTRYNSSQIGC